MIFKQKTAGLIMVFLTIWIIITGCNSTNKLNPDVTEPQLIVNPDNISLGIATIMETEIVFEGSGFPPDDSVFITLNGPNDTKVVIADGKIYPDGKFTAQVTFLAKVTGLLNANITGNYSSDGKYNPILVITKDPLPTGAYRAIATGMISDQKAETKFMISKPTMIDRIKDWLGIKTGKIKIRKA